MTIADKVRRAKTDFDEVHTAGVELGKALGGYTEGFEAGKQEEYDAFWDALQITTSGLRDKYEYAFAGTGWNDKNFKPKYDIILGLGFTGSSMFVQSGITDLMGALERQGVKMDTTLCGYMQSMFQGSQIKRIPALNCSHAMDYNANGLNMTFINSQVETIDKLIVHEALVYKSAFQGCANLKNIVFEGSIGNDINFQWSNNLTKASITSIVEALSLSVDYSEGKTLTLSKKAVDDAFVFYFDDPMTGESVKVQGTDEDNPYWWEIRNRRLNWNIEYA